MMASCALRQACSWLHDKRSPAGSPCAEGEDPGPRKSPGTRLGSWASVPGSLSSAQFSHLSNGDHQRVGYSEN